MKHIILAVLAGAALVSGQAVAASQPKHFDGEKLVAHASVTMAQAEAIAMKARPGKIVHREAEKEAGGSGLRYSFDIKADGKTYEVGVDTKTGAVLENGAEGAAEEAHEAD
ncbi:PepSY domain-containing protein [Asticcacaulis sp. EMRT-3]|uniref:PepSY domain-containing protein n=1 Tax=Asticcacaulis sp. EMRT-3 TaxID=3040349 RepID=UPI0024AFCA61|nr:PepSY domain-containing protein [Asticcacaulis sp. EMRT-3]MDI7776522.1 PepSY domain-containing protein [Asticcacaulis sp. EMRT-3]